MTPTQARTAFDNLVGEIVGGDVPVLSVDEGPTADMNTAWVRTALVHDNESTVELITLAGEVTQPVTLTATVFAPHGEASRSDYLAEAIRSGISSRRIEGMRIYTGMFLEYDPEDDDEIDNFKGLSVVFPASYPQEK